MFKSQQIKYKNLLLLIILYSNIQCSPKKELTFHSSQETQQDSANHDNDIVIITTDKSGEFKEQFVSQSEYEDKMATAANTVNDSLTPNLVNIPQNLSWKLRTIAVGVGVNMEFGVGLVSVGATPRARLIYTNNFNPAIP